MFCGQSDVRKLDKLQHRTLRFVYNDFDALHSELLSRSKTISASNYLTYIHQALKCTSVSIICHLVIHVNLLKGKCKITA